MVYNYNYLEELADINEILQKDNLSIYDRIFKVILYEFDIYREIFKNYFSLEEYLSMVEIADDIPPTITEIRKIERLVDCLVNISKYKLTKVGLREKYPELATILEKYIIWDINEKSSIQEIYNCVESSDIIKLKKKIKKGIYGNFKEFYNHLLEIQDLTYQRYREEREIFLSVYGREKSKKYLSRLYNFEMNTKFKIDSYLFNRIKALRERNILSIDGIDIYDLIDLRENIAPIYWHRIPRIIWNGLKKEYNKIKRIHNIERKTTRKGVFIFRYTHYSDRIKDLKLWHLD